MVQIKNSWYLVRDLSACRNLFEGQPVKYKVHFVQCRCGYFDTIVFSASFSSFRCPECENDSFIDGFNAKTSDYFLQEDGIVFNYEAVTTNGVDGISVSIDVPVGTDYMRGRIVFERRELYRHTVSLSDDECIWTFSMLPNTVVLAAEKLLFEQVSKQYATVQLPYAIRRRSLNMARFFLYAPTKKYAEFYHWILDACMARFVKKEQSVDIETMLIYLLGAHKERSVKRTLFKLYADKREKLGYRYILRKGHEFDTIFDARVPFVLCRSFNDPNLLSVLIGENLLIAPHDYSLGSLEDENHDTGMAGVESLIWFLHFLKKHYTEKQLARLLRETREERSLWFDVLMMMTSNKSAIKKMFQKVKPTVEHLHNELNRIIMFKHRSIDMQRRFIYEAGFQKRCGTFGDLTFILPASGRTLYHWAKELHNCMWGYLEHVASRESTIFGVTKAGKLSYAIEIQEGRITQMSGNYNSKICDPDKTVILDWHKLYSHGVMQAEKNENDDASAS